MVSGESDAEGVFTLALHRESGQGIVLTANDPELCTSACLDDAGARLVSSDDQGSALWDLHSGQRSTLSATRLQCVGLGTDGYTILLQSPSSTAEGALWTASFDALLPARILAEHSPSSILTGGQSPWTTSFPIVDNAIFLLEPTAAPGYQRLLRTPLDGSPATLLAEAQFGPPMLPANGMWIRPDGRTLEYIASVDDLWAIFRVSLDGSSPPVELMRHNGELVMELQFD
ncbi:MAG: hypothetical protein RBU37_03935 [Myxococcota bacterium]|nr:hypothetical protein [Myxococcota bacterium]